MPTTTPPRTEPKPLIVIVEDEAELAALIALHLEKAGMHTQVCSRAAHALKFLKKNFANLLLLDITLPDQSGFSMLEELKKMGVTVPVIFLTGNIEETSKVRGLDMGGTTTSPNRLATRSSSPAFVPCCGAPRRRKTRTSRKT